MRQFHFGVPSQEKFVWRPLVSDAGTVTSRKGLKVRQRQKKIWRERRVRCEVEALHPFRGAQRNCFAF
jgi:hypothetical protein